MGMVLHFDGENIEDIKYQMMEYMKSAGWTILQTVPPEGVKSAEISEPRGKPGVKKERKGKFPPVVIEEITKPKVVKERTLEEVTEMLKRLVSERDKAVAKQVLAHFNALRLSDLRKENWDQFIIVAEKMLAQSV